MKRINWEHPESLVTLRSPRPLPSPRDCAVEGRSSGDITTKFSRLDKIPLFLINGALLARFKRKLSYNYY